MDDMFKGGRGKEAPYGKTSIVRIPTAIKPQLEAISSTYRELKMAEKTKEVQQFLNSLESIVVCISYKRDTQLPTYEQAKEIANKLLAQKKSKQTTIEKLLQVLYNSSDSGETEK